jgi:uroporphyrinogen decarboxylase
MWIFGPVRPSPIRSEAEHRWTPCGSRTRAQVEALRAPDPRESVPFVFEIIRSLRRELADRAIPLLGFAGAPFTLAAYLVEGQGSRSFSKLKRMLYREPEVLRALLARLVDQTVDYLNAQIEAGAQVVQLFDTWAGLLSPEEYREWVLPGHQEIAARVNRSAAPLILYVNDGAHVVDEMVEAGTDVISLDWRVDLAAVAKRHGSRVSLQGNLDPCALHAPREVVFDRVRALAQAGRAARGHVLNLGHGCLPDTPVEGVRAFTDAARAIPSP